MDKNKVVKLVVDYLLTLPEGSSLTLVKVMDIVCPQYRNSVSDGDLLGILSEVRAEMEKQGILLDFSNNDGKEIGLPFVFEFVIRKA